MNNMQDEEKDLYIRKRFKKDDLVSKKYDDVFEKFLKGEHEMKEEPKFETKENKPKKQKKAWVRPFAAVAACTLIVTGANVYATTQGYDNIFFLIKDLGNKNKTTVSAQKDEILSDRDTTISYTNIKISDGLFIQINKFVVKDGKASLFVKVDQTDADRCPGKFIVDSNGVNLVTEKINQDYQKNVAIEYIVDDSSYISKYDYEIKLNNYTENMKILELTIKDEEDIEITTLKIDLENKEIDLLGSDSGNGNVNEVSKISEIDLKEKLGYYAIIFRPATSRVLNDDDKFFLGQSLYMAVNQGKVDNRTSDGYTYYSKTGLNNALKEAIGDELGTTVTSEIFTYDKSFDGYKYISAGDYSTSGLCLNIDDLKYEDGRYVVTFTYCLPTEQDYVEGNIEKLDRYQATVEFTLNGNATYTKYKLINLGSVDPQKVETKKSEETTKPTEATKPAETTKPAEATKPAETTKPTEATKPAEDTTNHDFVKNSGYAELENETNSNKPNYDPSKVNNYASTMNWTEYWAPGLKFQYPTEWELSTTPVQTEYYDLLINAQAQGWAIGKNPDTNEIIESYMTITVYDQKVIHASSLEEAYTNVEPELGLIACGAGDYTLQNGDNWRAYWNSEMNYLRSIGDMQKEDTFYIKLSEVYDGGTPSGEYIADIVRIQADVASNYKVINITNKVIGSLKTTSK